MFGLEKLETKLTEFVNKLTSSKDEIIDSKEASEIDEKYAKERYDLFGEVTESAVARRLPWRGKVADLFTSVGVKEGDPEVVQRQREFESITAWTLFVPDFLLKTVTNIIIKVPGFETILKNYPLGGKVKSRLLDESGNIKAEPDPDDVINFLRLVNQDIITGKVTFKKIS